VNDNGCVHAYKAFGETDRVSRPLIMNKRSVSFVAQLVHFVICSLKVVIWAILCLQFCSLISELTMGFAAVESVLRCQIFCIVEHSHQAQ